MRPSTLAFLKIILVSTFASLTNARKTRITWVNGMAHSMDHMLEGQTFISKLFCGKPVVYCYNPTAMSHDADMIGYLEDLTQAGTQKLGRMTAEVESLIKHLKEAVSFVGKQGKVIHIAHSQGALITALAAKKLSPLEMGQIEVLSFGGASALRKTSCTPFSRCINYYSVNDPLLWVVPEAAQALRSGFVGQDNEFCFLAPKLGDPLSDHNLYGPTYGQALQWEGARFQRKYVSLGYRVYYNLYLFISLLFGIISSRLFAFVTFLLNPFLAWCSFCFLRTQSCALHVRNFFYETVFDPIMKLLVLIALYIRQIFAGREKYVPVQIVLEQSKQENSDDRSEND